MRKRKYTKKNVKYWGKKNLIMFPKASFGVGKTFHPQDLEQAIDRIKRTEDTMLSVANVFKAHCTYCPNCGIKLPTL